MEIGHSLRRLFARLHMRGHVWLAALCGIALSLPLYSAEYINSNG